MNSNTKMITCSSLREKYEDLSYSPSDLEPGAITKIAVRLAYLNSSDRTDLNLAANYCVSGKSSLVLAVLSPLHPMADIFNIHGEARDTRVVEYVRNHLERQNLEREISRLEALSI